MHHVHESPWVMLIPLFVLAVGAIVRRLSRRGLLCRRRPRRVLEAARSWSCRSTIRSAAAEELTGVDRLPAADRRRARHRDRLSLLFDATRTSRRGWRCSSARSTCSCSTNGTSTSSTTGCSCDSAFALGDGLWKTGDGAIIDGLGPDGIAAATRELAREASRLQTGYVYHYAFAMLIGVVALVTWYLLPR